MVDPAKTLSKLEDIQNPENLYISLLKKPHCRECSFNCNNSILNDHLKNTIVNYDAFSYFYFSLSTLTRVERVEKQMR